jgi:hypothetical protein
MNILYIALEVICELNIKRIRKNYFINSTEINIYFFFVI